MYPPIGCPHCHNLVGFDPRFAGHVVSCPHCRGAFQMPVPAPLVAVPYLPPATAHKVTVRVAVSKNGQGFDAYRPVADVNAVVALFPVGRTEKVPAGILYTMGERAQFDKVKRTLLDQGIFIGLAGGNGVAVLSSVEPGEYHLFIRSSTVPSLDPRRIEEAIGRFFDSGDDETGNPFDFTHSFKPLRQFQQQSLFWNAVHVTEVAVAPGTDTEYSYHFV